MAEIKPFRAWRYDAKVPYPIDELTSPLFDVVSESERKLLYENPYNSIHLSTFVNNDLLKEIAQRLTTWKDKKIINQDNLPAIYVYYQYFTLNGSKKIFCRKGFVTYIRTYDWDEKVVLGHENTMPEVVSYQAELLEKTELYISPTHGLYTDKKFLLEKLMDEAISNPIYETESNLRVKNVLAVIHDKKVIDTFVRVLENKKILLADGHHRYQGAINYFKKQRTKNLQHRGDESYNFHLMYLSNTEGDDLRIFPTHRLVTKINPFNKKKILRDLSQFFYITPISKADTVEKILAKKSHHLAVLFKEDSYAIQIKLEWKNAVTWEIPEVVKKLDVVTLHYFVLEKVLKMPRDEQGKFGKIEFEQNLSTCLDRVNSGQNDMAIVMPEITIEDIQRVCRSGHTMPQKSTYFYPKIISGLLFGSIKDNEF